MYHKKLILLSFVSSVLLSMSVVQVSISVRPALLCSICRCIFFPFGMYSDGIFHCSRQRRLPYWTGKNPSEVTGNGVPTACCSPRHSMRKVFVLSFQIFFIFPIVAAHVLNVFQALLSAEFNWFLKSVSWHSCFTFFTLGSLMRGTFCLK